MPLILLIVLTLTIATGPAQAAGQGAASPPPAQGCTNCHPGKDRGFAPGHAFAATRCSTCHQGDPGARQLPQAHAGLIGFPGDFANVKQTCAPCHGDIVSDVTSGFMATGRGIVSVTRGVFGEQDTPGASDGFAQLGQSPADSLLRKLCASCHLGQPKARHGHDPIADRGGGCPACHINAYPADAHPRLSTGIRDERCFGCHSRSSRISLNYAGLAEIGRNNLRGRQPGSVGRLGDRRLVEHKAADAHHRAGLACIDCHTVKGLMSGGDGLRHHEDAVDIACLDCHDNRSPRAVGAARPGRSPFRVSPEQPFLVTARHGTPLWHIEVRSDGNYLHPKLGGAARRIPQYGDAEHPLSAQHARLSCDACHAQWAPQCYGCHTGYAADKAQWDHLARARTFGRWEERRWNVRNTLPPLGVFADGRIGPFVPGMVLTLEHPDWPQPRFRRLFASISPHTTGPARTCASCHSSGTALGLGRGQLHGDGGEWRFEPEQALLEDGLAEDAWTTLDSARPGAATRVGERSFTRDELLRVLDAGPRD